MKKTLLTLAIGASLGLTGTSASALVLLDFSVSPQSVHGTGSTFTADKMVGGYVEDFSVTASGVFVTNAFWDATAYYKADGTISVGTGTSKLISVDPGNPTGSPFHSLYGLFDAAGTFVTDGAGNTTFTGGSGTISLWLDKSSDTGKSKAAGDLGKGYVPFTISPGVAGDDVLIGSTAVLFTGDGQSKVCPGGGFGCANGNFEIVFDDLTLTATGKSYFTAPVPFYPVVSIAGQFNSFDVVGDQRINGSADVIFKYKPVPEPATLALLGLGMAGMGVALRRRKA